MSERSELRSRREERMENGVKNLKGSKAISQSLSIGRIGNDYENPEEIDYFLSNCYSFVK